MKKSYTLFLNSNNQIPSQTTYNNNNPSFNIVWDSFLPKGKTFRLTFNFETSGQYREYTSTTADYGDIKICADFVISRYTYNSYSNSGGSILGYALRNLGFLNSIGQSTISCGFLDNPPIIINRPTSNIITFYIYNMGTSGIVSGNGLLNDTISSTLTTYMAPWQMVLNFECID